jgi:hypothetical protein
VRVVRDEHIINVQLKLRHDFEYPPKWKPQSTEAEDFFNSLQAEPTK